MQVALFGGTFDPPHKGHELVADTLIAEDIVDEVWFVPVFKHPWAERYQKQISSYNDRVAMLEIIAAGRSNQRVAHFKDVSFTYDILRYFVKEYPENEFFWVMGSEYLRKFEDFLVDHPQLMEFPFLIYPREGYELKPVYGNMLVLDEVPTIKISSTEVRKAVEQNAPLKNLVHTGVAEYIVQNKLY